MKFSFRGSIAPIGGFNYTEIKFYWEPNDVAYQKKGNFMSDAMMHMKFSFRGSIAPMTGAEYTKLFFCRIKIACKIRVV